MPSIPPSKRRPWQPASSPRPTYQRHAARDARYSTAQWQRARLAQLQRQPCCAECTRQGRTTIATVCDHIKPVRLGADFWDSSNYQSLCHRCHQAKSATERTQTA
jgi:5-methylcytosine-specific restriction protein A